MPSPIHIVPTPAHESHATRRAASVGGGREGVDVGRRLGPGVPYPGISPILV